VTHVVLDVEGGIVDPHRPPHLEARERQLLPVAGHEVEAVLHVLDHLVVGRRRTLEGDDRAHVHVGRLALLSEEGGVDRAEPVLVARRH
jgi:hypothetical protein